MTRDFDELVDLEGLSDEERRRLENVHEMLVAAGPPPDLPAALQEPPEPGESGANVVPLTSRPRGRRAVWGSLAAAIALVCFGGGYALGTGDGDGGVVRVVALEGQGDARGSVKLREVEPGGNWPMELEVTGLPRQAGDRAYYELFVWRDGKPGYPCVGFKMRGGTTTVRFTVPYELKEDTQLVVTEIEPGKISWPGNVVMRTA